MYSPKQSTVAYAGDPEPSIRTDSAASYHHTLMDTFRGLDFIAISRLSHALHEITPQSTLEETLQSYERNENDANRLVVAGNFKAFLNRDAYINQNAHTKQDAKAQTKKLREKEGAMSAQNEAYKKPLIGMLLELCSLLDCN